MKKFISIITIIILINFFSINVSAHSIINDVEYDECIPSEYVDETNIGDGYNEKWYDISQNNTMRHIENSESGVTTISYYFNNTSTSGTVKWIDYLKSEQLEEFKTNFVNSMKKWDKVFIYCNNGEYYTKKKLVNIVEGTEENHNVSIKPNASTDDEASVAMTKQDPFYIGENIIIEDERYLHKHISKWMIEINVKLAAEYLDNETLKSTFLKRTGAHEIGHILGLYDIDGIENSQNYLYHHEELLMGYSQFNAGIDVNFQNRQTEITYRDIIGAAILRGYHTDDDHEWLCDNNILNGKYKLICSICNGVKYVESLNNITYNIYKACNENHNLVDGNMIPVASYENKDYYKCKYCRFVAPATAIVEQNYVTSYSYDLKHHYIMNNVLGLQYKMLEEHEYDSNINAVYCKKCNNSILMDEIMVTDPDYLTKCGSQINVYERDIVYYDRSYRGNQIVQGYTRLLYFANILVPSYSRLDYEWTSSNSNVAKVSAYGTVTALDVTEPTQVIISARHKTTNIIFYKKLLIIPDTSNELITINYEVQMNKSENYVLTLDEKCPVLSVQEYNWEVIDQNDETINVTISQWGTINATSPGIFYIKGTYKLNNNVIILVEVEVI